MNENSGFAAFELYNALKLHFTSKSYDYFKYNGKHRGKSVSKETFLNRKDKYTFYKLSRKYNPEKLRDFYVSNFIEGRVEWIGEMMNQDGEETYTKWQKRNQSLTYTFTEDIINLLDKYEPIDLLKVSEGYPMLLKELMEKTICIETVILMNRLMNFLPMWEKRIDDDIIWPSYQLKLRKYEPFVVSETSKVKNILKEKIKEHAEA